MHEVNPFEEMGNTKTQEGGVFGDTVVDMTDFGVGAAPKSKKDNIYDILIKSADTRQSRLDATTSKMKDWLGVILQSLGKYAKEAFELAVYKFTVELAAMVVAAIAALVTNKRGKPMDISTDGVFYRAAGTQPTTAAPATGTTTPRPGGWDSNPFNDWNNSRNIVSPW